MTTTIEAELSATDSGSNGISATPRRGRGRSDTLPYVGRIATQGEATQAHGSLCDTEIMCYVLALARDPPQYRYCGGAQTNTAK